MKNMISYLLVFAILIMVPVPSFSQGFKKLNVKDKYGVKDSMPIQPKQKGGDKDSDEVDAAPEQGLPDGMMYLNGTDVDLKEMITQISALTGKNFIINDKIRGKITIISDKPMSKEMAYQAFLSALEINGFTTTMTPAGLINIIPHKDSHAKPKDLYKGPTPITDKFVTRIISLENISANEIATVIKSMISKSGNLFPYPTTNSLILTDTGSNIDHIMKLVRELDKEGPQEVLDMIPIINANAKTIADMITQIFEKDDKGNKSRTRRRGRKQEQLEDVQQISKVIADERTNSVLIMGTKRSIIKVRALIARLDRSIGGAEGRIHVYYLKYAKAEDVSKVLSNLVENAKTKASAGNPKSGRGAQKASSSGGSVTLEGGVKVTADESTNSLIIVASAKDYKTLVRNVIVKLDLLRPQVYLESVIMSLDVTKSHTLGFSGMGGLINTLAGGNQLTAFGTVLPSSSSAISAIAGASGGLGAGLISSETINLTLQDGSSVAVPAVSAIMQALASNTDANVLSTPSIMTLDNEEAEIQVGQEVPIPTGTTVSSGVTTFDVSREDTGIILKITPQISDNDMVRLSIAQEITSVFTSDPNLGPTLDKKSVDTVVLAKNKQTVVIGGLIDDQATVTSQKVPLLGDIPVLGALFRTRTTTKQKTNLIVFITPYIVRERKDYQLILRKKIEERNQFINANYGAGQRKIIRKAISNHAEDLLEFKCLIPTDEDPCLYRTESQYQLKSSKKKSKKKKKISKNKKNKAVQTSSFGPPQKVKFR
ncbi:type II secretion system protein GspD [bacterium K02(2017)]|nr:type II secretion system protein GspD [bacterium K02(2017)]